jgi:hypothetical protein
MSETLWIYNRNIHNFKSEDEISLNEMTGIKKRMT